MLRGCAPDGLDALKRAQTKKGNSPLHFACFLGHLECVEELLKCEGTIEQKDKAGHTALHFACSRGDVATGGGVRGFFGGLLPRTASLPPARADPRLLVRRLGGAVLAAPRDRVPKAGELGRKVPPRNPLMHTTAQPAVYPHAPAR